MSMSITVEYPKGRHTSLYVIHPDHMKVSEEVMTRIGEIHKVKITKAKVPCDGLVGYDDLLFYNFRGTHAHQKRVAKECISWGGL